MVSQGSSGGQPGVTRGHWYISIHILTISVHFPSTLLFLQIFNKNAMVVKI